MRMLFVDMLEVEQRFNSSAVVDVQSRSYTERRDVEVIVMHWLTGVRH